MKEQNKQIVEKFKAIRDIADNFLTYPEAPDPDQFMEQIEKKIAEYGELLQPRCAITEISRLLEEHGYEHRESYSSLTQEEIHHFILGTILISIIVNENADEETLESIRG